MYVCASVVVVVVVALRVWWAPRRTYGAPSCTVSYSVHVCAPVAAAAALRVLSFAPDGAATTASKQMI